MGRKPREGRGFGPHSLGVFRGRETSTIATTRLTLTQSHHPGASTAEACPFVNAGCAVASADLPAPTDPGRLRGPSADVPVCAIQGSACYRPYLVICSGGAVVVSQMFGVVVGV